VAVSAEVGEILNTITHSVEKVSQLIGEVSSASGEQADGIKQINTAIGELDKITQSNAANAEEAAAASQELSTQVRELNDLILVLVAIAGKGKRNGRMAGGHDFDGKASGAAAGNGILSDLVHLLKNKEAQRSAGTGSETPENLRKAIPLDDHELAEF